MAYSSTSSNSEVSTDSNCSSSCLENVKILKEQNEQLLKDLRTSKLNAIAYKIGKFDGKDDEGFFVGYSINSKAFRVFNSRTRIVEENQHVQFSENTPNITRSGPNWLFDIDALTNSPDAGFKPSSDGEKKINSDPSKEDERDDQEKDDNVNSTNNINTVSDGNNANNVNVVSSTVNAAGIKVNAVGAKTSIELPDDPNMLELEDIVYSDDDKDVDAEVDMNNLDAFMLVSPIPTTKIHKDHLVEQIIRDLNSAPQTRKITKNLEEHEEPQKVIHALKDPSLIEAMQDELLQFKLQNVWTLVDLPNGKRVIGTKWVYRNKKDERGIVIKKQSKMDVKSAFLYGKIEKEVYVCQPPGFKDPDLPDRVYKVEKALYRLHQALGAWYETLSTYLLDNGFQRGKIDKTLFIRRGKSDILLVQVYVDDIIFGYTKKSLCTKFEKMMHKKFQISSMGELTFFLELQALLKDEDGEEVDVYLYRSMIGSLMYLTSSRPNNMFAVCACARYQVNLKVSHLHAVKRTFRYLKGQPKLGLWYLKDSPFDLVAYTDSDYAGASLDRKSITGGFQFLGCRLISWLCKKQTVVANSTTEAEYLLQVVVAKDSNKKKLIQMIKIHTNKNIADLLTKAFDVKTVNEEVQLPALVDGKKIIITEASIRRDLQLDYDEGMDCLSNATIFEELTRIRYEKLSQKLTFYKAFFSPQWKILIHTVLQCLSAKTTAWNEFSSIMASAIIFLAINQKFNFSKYIFENMVKNLKNVSGKFLMRPKEKDIEIPQSSVPSDLTNVADEAVNEEPSMQLKKLMDFCTKLQQRVLDLQNIKTAQAQEITSLKLRVKRLEKKGRSRTHKLKRLYKIGRSARVVSSDEASLGDQEDASKQEKKIDDIDADAEITLVDETQGRHDDDLMFDTGVLNDEKVFAGQDMAEKEVSTADPVTTAGEVVTTADVAISTVSIILVSVAATITEDEIILAQALAELKSVEPKVTTATTTATKGILLQEPSESRTTTTTTIPSKDKGKGIMVEEPLKMKKKDQISFDEQEAIRLQAELDEEVRLAREKDEANVALIEEWNDIQAKIETDYELAQRLQAEEQEELTIEERAKLFQQLLEKRRKHFAAKRAEEKRNRPPTKAQQRSITYMDTELVKGSKAKKQKVNEDKEIDELQSLMKVIPDEEEVAVDVIPLATKPPSIMLRSFDREDLETLWKLVKAKHGYTRPEEGYERVLWGDLKIMFGHHVEDLVWRNLQGNKVLV
ncbi:putative ribonuclease H-like domain-containing protein [Tanacetum coccineum]